jgi:hypothetical protein
MRKMVIAALLGLPLLTGTVFGQTAPGPQTAAVEASPRAAPTAPNIGAITREQYIQRAQDRAAQRAAARFDQMDSDHDGVLDRSERRAWRNQHARRPAAQTAQPAAQ